MPFPTLKLSNGLEMPVVGLGTYASGPKEVVEAVKDAIDAGYRHFDCAYLYGNEEEVGEGIRAKIEDGTVKREDLFVVTKLWNTYHRKGLVVPMCKESLKNLGLDYVDLYLVHCPMSWQEGGDFWPTKNGATIDGDVDYLETWQGMEECQSLGLAKSIGVSNFNSEQIDRLLANCRVKPVNNQVEVNPNVNQKKLIDFCKQKGIVVSAFCPLGRPAATKYKPKPSIKDPKIIEIAAKHKKSPAQVVLKYLVDLGISVLPKSVTKSRIIENINIFDFKLAAEDTAYIDSLNCNSRICEFPEAANCKYYPFSIEY